MLYEKSDDESLRCLLCAHHCRITPGKFGICGVRQNKDGRLITLVYGAVKARGIDPIEKKPLYHFLPASASYSIATAGCNFKCGFCQNWQISQDAVNSGFISGAGELMPDEIVSQAQESGCQSISYTYSEPTVFFEYAYDTARLARSAGLYNVFVTNGFMSKGALDMIKPYLDAANVDLKSLREEFYRSNCQGRLQPVLDSIAYMVKLGIWIELTTLVIPGENDSPEELNAIAEFIAGIDKNIPWHISRFHPDYHFIDRPATPLPRLQEAKQIGASQGLRFVYLGNVSGASDTLCYNCKGLLVKREYFSTQVLNIRDAKCSFCGAAIAGFWN